MRKKELKLIVTFHTTADAMAMEKACKDSGAPGRYGSWNRNQASGSGLSWCAALEDREEIRSVMKAAGIEEEELHECMV